MLILTRRIGESVHIGDEVRLTVLGVRGTQVRLGINAPKDIPVHREEIYYRIKHEQGGPGGGYNEGGNQGYHRHEEYDPNRGGGDYDEYGNRSGYDNAGSDYDDAQPMMDQDDDRRY